MARPAPTPMVISPPLRPELPPTRTATNLEVAGSWLSPGRTIRMPVGYVLLGSALLIVILSLAYGVGYKSGQRAGQAKYQQDMVASAQGISDGTLRSLDPLTDPPPKTGKQAANPSNSSRSNANANVRSTPASSWGPVIPKDDPRKKGLRYFILMSTTEQGAVRLAEFCRANGLETYVIKGKNSDLRRVIAFPGFALPDRSSPQVKALEGLIENIDEKWKRTEKNSTGLRGFYPETFDG